MTDFATLPGDPATLSGFAARYEGFAAVILQTAAHLDTVVDDRMSVGESVDAVRHQAADVASTIRKVQPRYRETALALTEYAVKLQDAQDRAAQAMASGIREQDELAPLYHRQSLLEGEHQRILLYPASPTEEQDWDRDMRHFDAQIGALESSLQGASTAYEAAVAERDRAAEVAMARISSVLGTMNDHLLDHVKALLGDIGDVLGAVGKWIFNVLVPILLDTLLIVEAIGLALTVLALILSPAGIIALLIFGASNGFNLEDMKNDIIRALLVVLPVLLPALALMLAREAATPTPAVTRQDPFLGTQLIKDTPTTYGDEMAYNGVLDTKGGEDKTIIGVTEVLDADGNRIGWRVTLPSTQDWELAQGIFDKNLLHTHADMGGVNDLGSNLALMLTPDQKDAYERAVIEAMKQAGVGPNDPVMLCGWSQGGILAGRMASDPSVPFNIKAIYVAGAPIDGMKIPPDVSVMSMQHKGEPVASLDGVPAAAPDVRANWATITTASSNPHNNGTYTATAGHSIDTDPSAKVQYVKDLQSQFFSGNEIEHRFETHE
ncbi:MAG: hypothetical protein JWN80_1307 [Microbacteriaceae bacterium]|nr:hypothetical protein [Microbacteriaceae bacterium]